MRGVEEVPVREAGPPLRLEERRLDEARAGTHRDDLVLLTPVSRLALLLGLMVADFVLVASLCLPVLLLGSIVGVKFTTGLAGVLAFVVLSGAWGVAFTGFPYGCRRTRL